MILLWIMMPSRGYIFPSLPNKEPSCRWYTVTDFSTMYTQALLYLSFVILLNVDRTLGAISLKISFFN